MENIIFWLVVFVSFGLGGIACWVFLAQPAIERAYFNGGFDSFPEHFEAGRLAGLQDAVRYASTRRAASVRAELLARGIDVDAGETLLK